MKKTVDVGQGPGGGTGRLGLSAGVEGVGPFHRSIDSGLKTTTSCHIYGR